jgi:hypothetical protein
MAQIDRVADSRANAGGHEAVVLVASADFRQAA